MSSPSVPPEPILPTALSQDHWQQMVLDATTDIMFAKDLMGRYQWVNRAYADLLQRPPESLIGQQPEDFWPTEIARTLRRDDLQVLENRRPCTLLEWLETDGTPLPLLVVKGPLYHQGELVGSFGIARDIRELWSEREQQLTREKLYSSIFERSGDGLFVVDPDTLHFVEFNTAAHEHLGYSREDFARLTVMDLQAEPDPTWLAERIRVLQKRGYDDFENRHRARDGSIRKVWVSNRLINAGSRAYVATVVRDLTLLEQSRALLEQAESLAHLGSWELDLTSQDLTWSMETYRIFEQDSETQRPSYTSFLERVHPHDRARVDEAYRHSVEQGVPYQIRHRLRFPDGREKVVFERGQTDYSPQGQPIRSFGTVQEITELARTQEQLETLAFTDALTGLPNREQSLRHLLQALQRQPQQALVLLNLDGFRRINDSLGRQAGDQLLCCIAEALSEVLSPEDWLARLGGGEFLIIRPDVDETAAIALVVDLQACFTQITCGSLTETISITACAGISLSPEHETNAEPLLQMAATALQQARHQGPNGYAVYRPALTEQLRQQLQQEVELRQALARSELFLVYQPQVNPQGQLVGLEALVRWQHPERGLVAPDEFIPTAERCGLIHALGRWVMDAACAQLAEWQRQGLEPPTLAVNLSPLQLQEGVTPLSHWLQPILEAHGIRPGDLELEITESCLLPESGILVDGELERLRSLGISLAIDDFGTGYSSLQVLHRLPVQTLKIDRSFVDPLEQDHSLQTIVRTILLLAQGLGLRTLAEGVETEFQARLLTALGCTAFQGYYFSRPLNVIATTDLLRAGPQIRIGSTAEES